MRYGINFLGLCGLMLLLGCSTSGPPRPSANHAFLLDTEERVHSEVLQRDQRVVLVFELVDGMRLSRRLSLEQGEGYWVPSGPRRVQFRVLLPSASWLDGRPREARAVVDVDLLPGRSYRVAGKLDDGLKHFYLADASSGVPVTEPIDIGFLAPVGGPTRTVPILIPVR